MLPVELALLVGVLALIETPLLRSVVALALTFCFYTLQVLVAPYSHHDVNDPQRANKYNIRVAADPRGGPARDPGPGRRRAARPRRRKVALRGPRAAPRGCGAAPG